KYKLIHYYYDIDEWELFDLEDDPYEMNNLAANPDFSDVLSEMKKELHRLRVHYQDTVPEKYLPPLPDTISHLAKGASYTLEYQPSERYPGNPACLTDGIVYPEGESYSMTYEGWCGFNGDDLILELDLGQVMKVSKISAGFLQNQERWIFLPDSMEFHTSEDGVDYMIIPVAQCGGPTEDRQILKRVAAPEYPGINTRYIKIHVMNNVLPEWHRNAGKPAWLFVDEIVVSGE
ncbi:MAG: DUF4976 domain-containing protein, partial [Bacteroidales bacterium]|nr:DUF4976 domain-containing protein [Bacteroidales bacterium]